jgi:hypothetical protein
MQNAETVLGVLLVTGELDDRKRSYPVREGVVGSRTTQMAPRLTAYLALRPVLP